MKTISYHSSYDTKQASAQRSFKGPCYFMWQAIKSSHDLQPMFSWISKVCCQYIWEENLFTQYQNSHDEVLTKTYICLLFWRLSVGLKTEISKYLIQGTLSLFHASSLLFERDLKPRLACKSKLFAAYSWYYWLWIIILYISWTRD